MSPAPVPNPVAVRGRRAVAAVRAALGALVIATASQALAQSGPLAAMLPASTVVAFHATDLQPSSGFWDGVLQAAGYEDVAPVLERLLALAGDEVAGSFGMGGELDALVDQGFESLAAECPELAGRLAELHASERWGSAVFGVSLSRFNPLPGFAVVYRPAEPELVGGLYGDLVYCFASEVSLNQDGVALDVFGDGSDQPLIAARVGSDVIVASNVELARTVVRLASGSNEPSHLRTPIGQLAANMMSEGVGVTVDLAALADGARGLIGMIPAGDAAAALVLKLLASLETVSGMAFNATFDEGGLVFDSVVTVDDSFGESELAALVLGTGAALEPPVLIPRGAATLSVGHFSLPALIAWVDSWLAAAAPLIGEEFDVRGLADQHLGIDLDSALLDWLGTTWHVAEHEVPGTDLLSYLVGMEGVMTLPVTSEAAAQGSVQELVAAASRAIAASAALAGRLPGGDLDLPDPLAYDDLGWDDMVSVKQQTYRGVEYQRWRVGPTTDVGFGVFGGHLVLANPAATMTRVIDTYLGGGNVLTDAALGHLVSAQAASQSSYEVVDLPRYLRGLAEIADVGAAPLATGVRALLRDGVASGDLTVDAAELPTFAELVALGDFVADLLDAMAARTGAVVGSSEVVGSALWSTLRVPLR